MELLNRIKEKLEENNMSVRSLEIKSGLSNGNIKKWEVQKPSYDKVLNVANALNVSVEWLITGKEPNGLTEEENRLIECYRKADPPGKDAILGQAEFQASKAVPEGVSVSRTG